MARGEHKQWAAAADLNPNTLASRLARGWSLVDALTEPKRRGRPLGSGRLRPEQREALRDAVVCPGTGRAVGRCGLPAPGGPSVRGRYCASCERWLFGERAA